MSQERQYQFLRRRDWFDRIFRLSDGRLAGSGWRSGHEIMTVIDEPISERMAYLIGDLPIPPRVYMFEF